LLQKSARETKQLLRPISPRFLTQAGNPQGVRKESNVPDSGRSHGKTPASYRLGIGLLILSFWSAG
jgi:hypothetical protein